MHILPYLKGSNKILTVNLTESVRIRNDILFTYHLRINERIAGKYGHCI